MTMINKLGFISNNYIIIVRIFYGPILSKKLSNKASNFFYISGVGFLVGIEQEYKFHSKKLTKKVACMFAHQ